MQRFELDLPASSAQSGTRIGTAHFGANFLFNRVVAGDGIAEGSFDDLARHLDIAHLRYPGGTMAEQQFDLADPDNDFQPTNLITGQPIANAAKHALTPLGAFLDFAVLAGAKVSVVLPSLQYAAALLGGDPIANAAAEAEIKGFVSAVLSGPHASSIETFELGNEWASIGFASASDYGRVADRMAVWVQQAIDAVGGMNDPAIAIQASARAARPDESAAIVSRLSPEARAAIDAVIVHNYRPVPWEQQGVTAGKFGHVDLFEQATGRDLATLVTEWNVGNASDGDGLLQGAGLLEMFNQMVRLGMDGGHVWPLLENNTTRLADADTGLHLGGEIFRQMKQSLPGTFALDGGTGLDLDSDGQTDLLAHAYGADGQDGMVIFLSSLTDGPVRLALDLAALAPRAGADSVVWLTTTGVQDPGAPLSPDAVPVVHAVALDAQRAVLDLDLEAYQIVRIELSGQAINPVAVADGAGADHIRLGDGAEVVTLANDGIRDLVRGFSLGADRLDVSALGATGIEDLAITNLVRKDGSTSWIQVAEAGSEAELALRFRAADPLDAAALRPEHFIFAAEAPAPPPSAEVPDSLDFDDIRLTAAREIVRLADDGLRDLVRWFDPGQDLLDVSALGIAGYDALSLRPLIRKDGSTNWIALSDPQGQDEVLLRLEGENDIALLTEDHFIFG